MKGQEIVSYISQAKMPNKEQVREICKQQEFIKANNTQKRIWLSVSLATACIVLLISLTVVFLFHGEGVSAYAVEISFSMPDGSSILMEDSGIDYAEDPNRLASSVSYVDSFPQLNFFITGEDIAKIEITTETESVRALDWTETLDEKFWNHELYYEEIELNDEVYQYIPSRNIHFKSNVLIFPEDFYEYDQIWYSWLALNLLDWASEDKDSRIQGFNNLSISEIEELYESMTDEERLEIAAGGGGTSTAGHILLDGCPEELLSDRIIITITDRQGNITERIINISISNNAIGQTVVTAILGR